MSTEWNKSMERRMVDEALNQGKMKAVEECLDPEFIYHGPGGSEVKGIEGYKQFLGGLRAAYPDIHVTIENILAEEDLAATRTLCTFTSAGKNVTLSGSIVDRFKGGKIAETWEQYDRLDLYQQLGINPVKPVL